MMKSSMPQKTRWHYTFTMIIEVRKIMCMWSKMDLGTKMGLGRDKNKSSQNNFKMYVCVGLIDTNPTQLERTQIDTVCERYRGMFI